MFIGNNHESSEKQNVDDNHIVGYVYTGRINLREYLNQLVL